MSAADTDPVQAAYREGRRLGLATAALAVSLVAFINILGFEKTGLAIVLACLSLQGAQSGGGVARRGRAALVIAGVHLVTLAAIVALFHDKLMQLVHLLQKLA